MAAAASSLSSIGTFSSSSYTSPLSLPPFDHSFTRFSPNFTPPNPRTPKTLVLKCPDLTLSPLPLLFPLSHLCHSSAFFNDTENSNSAESEEDPDGEEQERGEQDEIEETCKLFVGNLPFSMTASELSATFSEAGKVRSAKIIYDRLTDRSRGFGFVTMGSIDEAKEAIWTFDGSQIGGRTVKVNFTEVPMGEERTVMGPKIASNNKSFVDTPHKIYAGNLGWGVTSQELRDAFADQPGFVSAKVIYERESGRSRGFGFVSFSSAESAQSALTSMNGVVVLKEFLDIWGMRQVEFVVSSSIVYYL
ncbi:hypothetical protein Cgig2_013218 [Carnegiea gigantea]|uniref:RRM domain-containing protein n=1 Tax=Carnegiea gigantea TaxID=171969 RepID=A0A9Q1KPA8_9CARY|nr:hypothetical protein Cgig2_013218 [Carnegiea gigantea]